MKPKRRRKVTKDHLNRAARETNPVVVDSGAKAIADAFFAVFGMTAVEEPPVRGDGKP